MKRGIIICIILLVAVNLVNTVFLVYPDTQMFIGTGFGVDIATVGFTILETRSFNITSPLNTTYFFNFSDPYTIDLNVTPEGFNVSDAIWTYTLWDLENNEIADSNVGFSPNSTFDAVKGLNKIIVYAQIGESIMEANVTFYVNTSESAPVLGPIDSPMYICETESMDYWFNVTDLDKQILHLTLDPSDPFYLAPEWTASGVETSDINLYSGVLGKTDATEGSDGWRTYFETISVTDQTYSDYALTNITVIEINNAPNMFPVGVQTVQTKGDDSTFYRQVLVNDVEEGNQDSGGLLFNISFSNETLFNITNDGIMNFTPNSSQLGIYQIKVCVNDTGIDNPHSDIFVECNQTGDSISNCENFSLTVTDENRAPTITDYYPLNLTPEAFGTEELYFNITKYDADGTLPDTYWYVDGVLEEYDGNNTNSSTDEFNYSFGCGVSGTKEVKAEITDGLLNDSVTWTFEVYHVACFVEPPGGGGGGGGSFGFACVELWGCSIWNVCQNTEKSLEEGLLSGEDYRSIKDECSKSGLDKGSCGFQIRTCQDINLCNTTNNKPIEVQTCHYTENPNCKDGIKNCHDGSCELLVDCGGPCKPCPTCSDNMQNQGEGGVDCGGPCPNRCPEVIPFLRRPVVLYSFIIIMLILILIVVIKIRSLILYHRELRGS